MVSFKDINILQTLASQTLLVIVACWLANQANADTLTRASGLVDYGPNPSQANGYGPQPNSSYLNSPLQNSSWRPTKIRITLTRNVSYVTDDSFKAPELSYFGVVGVGTPAKRFNVVFDTGSNAIWLPEKHHWLITNTFGNNLHYDIGYDLKGSSTSKDNDKSVTYTYRRTEMKGKIYEDTFTLYQGLEKEDSPVLPAAQMSFGQNFLAIWMTEDEQFRYKPYDGAVGLAPVALSGTSVRNILLSIQLDRQSENRQLLVNSDPENWHPQQQQQHEQYQQHLDNGPYSPPEYNNENFVSQHHRRNLVFGFWFNPSQHSRYGGELTIGGIDERRILGEVYFHRINSFFDWQLPVSLVRVGANVVSCSNGCNAILDTGANSLVGPQSDVLLIYQELSAKYNSDANLWIVDCNGIDQLPHFAIHFGNQPYVLYGRHYVGMFQHRNNLVCHLNIKYWNKQDWLLGTSFIGAYYTVFDFESRQIGFATPRNNF